MDDASLSKTRWFLLYFALLATVAVATPPGCSTYIGTTSKSFLHEARENFDPNIRYVAYAKLGSPANLRKRRPEKRSRPASYHEAPRGKEPVAVRAVIVRSLGNLGDHRARQEIIKAVNDVDNAVIRVEACRALGKVGEPEDATLLARIMTVDKLEDCRIAAIEGLGLLKANDVRIYGILLDGMEHDDPAIRFECLRSLRAITGKDFGVDPAAWRRELDPMLRKMATATSTEAAAAVRSKAAPAETRRHAELAVANRSLLEAGDTCLPRRFLSSRHGPIVGQLTIMVPAPGEPRIRRECRCRARPREKLLAAHRRLDAAN